MHDMAAEHCGADGATACAQDRLLQGASVSAEDMQAAEVHVRRLEQAHGQIHPQVRLTRPQ